MNRSTALLCLVLAHVACGGRPAIDDAAAPGPADTSSTTMTPPAPEPPPACTLDPGFPAGTSVVTCGLPPHVTLVGADAAAVYVLSEAGTFYRVDKSNGDRTLLYREPTNPEGGRTVFAAGLGDDAALAGGELLAFQLAAGVWALDPTRPSMPVNVLGDVFENRPLVDQASMYFLRVEMAPGSNLYIDVERAPIAGGATVVLDPTYDTPVALGGAFVYVATEVDGSSVDPPYPHLLRVPTAGGAVTPVLDTLDASGVAGSITADADAVYVIGSSHTSGVQGSYPITRFPVAGGAPTTLAILGPIDPEVPGPTPWGLRLDDAFVYFLGTPGTVSCFGSSSTLYRVPNAAPSSTPQLVAAATSLGPPQFDGEFVYVALQRGGTDDPIEGTVLRIPKSALQ
jgi:hypothetical protein